MVVSNADAKKAGINGFNNGIAGYPVGQCTGFVASILRANKVPESKYSYLGNGNQWAANAKSRGIKVDMKPSVGAVVSFKAYGSSYYGAYGHVAYITKVNSNGSVHLYEGNFSGLSFHERDANIDSAVAGVIHFSDGGGTTTPPKPNTKDSAAIQEFKKNGNAYKVTKAFRVDELKQINGMWQIVNYKLAGGKPVNWTNNGIPVAIVDKTDSAGKKTSNQVLKVGDYAKFMSSFDNGTIDAYDTPTNGVGIIMGKYGMIWFNADEFKKDEVINYEKLNNLIMLVW